ncbi:MAG: 2-oxoacid:acceptor oxidoreductase family protein [Actinobacteria bacterium]|nr:2-oxoacid:acceptor oxidoreductase family protein [Actinomycetota bacterium]
MQAEVILTGIGGQGVQLCAKALAMAAVAEGREALLSSHYGGEMRGGQTEASVVVADAGLRSLPILPSTWSAFVMHPAHWAPVAAKLRPGGVVVANADLVAGELLALDGVGNDLVGNDLVGNDLVGNDLVGNDLVGNDLVGDDGATSGCARVLVAAESIAGELGAPMAAGFVLLGAYASATGMVGTASLVAAMRDLVPPYRAQHVEANERAIVAGAAAVAPGSHPVWTAVTA